MSENKVMSNIEFLKMLRGKSNVLAISGTLNWPIYKKMEQVDEYVIKNESHYNDNVTSVKVSYHDYEFEVVVNFEDDLSEIKKNGIHLTLRNSSFKKRVNHDFFETPEHKIKDKIIQEIAKQAIDEEIKKWSSQESV